MMRGRNVILMTVLFLVSLSICGMAYGQGGPFLLGAHSPAMVYSPPTKLFMSVCQVYQWYNLYGNYIDPWGNTRGGFTPAWGSSIDDERAKPVIAYDTVNERSLTVWTGPWPYHDLYGQQNSDDFSSDSFVISNAPGVQANPVVTNDTVNGGFLVTWSDDRNIDGLAIYGQLVSAEGEFKGTEILIASGLFRGQVPSSYSVTYDYVNQRFLVVWVSIQSIHGQFINANGTLHGEQFTIVDHPGEDYPIEYVSLAYDGINQRYLVVWHLNWGLGDIIGQLVNADGTLLETAFAIALSSGKNPSVAFDNINQRFLVAWTWGYTDGQFVNPDGTLQGDGFSISHIGTTPYYYYDPPAIAFNPECGNFLVASVAKLDSGIKGLWAINSQISYTVVGDPCPSATLTVKMKGYGGKRKYISGAGMNCIKNVCSGQYWPGAEIDIGAWVDGKEAVAIWTGCNTVEDNRCHITMDSDKQVTVKFAKVPKRLR
jgi:hypothetical protein